MNQRIIYSFFGVLLSFFSFSLAFGQTGKFKVALDAGHGDHDFGAVYNGHIEKNINLAIALKVGKLLEKHSSIEVIYTRKTDIFVDLIERANIANRSDATIFVSIHCNANKNTAADGTETYVMGMSKIASNLEAAKRENSVISLEKDYKQKYEGFDPKRPESMLGMTLMQEEFLGNSIALAAKIQDNFVKMLGKKSRGGGVKQAPYMVLHKAYMPRVLIETGFVSNPAEGARLDSEEGQVEIADAIYKAILSYKKEYFDTDNTEDTIKPSERVEEIPISTTPKKDSLTKQNQIASESKPIKNNENQQSKGIVFKIQISVSSKMIATSASNFNGLNEIDRSQTPSGMYKYTYGATSNFDEAQKLLSTAKAKGFKQAFIIAFKDGKSIAVQEALK